MNKKKPNKNIIQKTYFFNNNLSSHVKPKKNNKIYFFLRYFHLVPLIDLFNAS